MGDKQPLLERKGVRNSLARAEDLSAEESCLLRLKKT